MEYAGKISEYDATTFTKTFNAGTTMLECVFVWDTATQEQYDIFARSMKTLRDADPLITVDNDIIRDYNYIEYYASLPATKTALEAQLDEGMTLPNSLVNRERLAQVNILWERRAEALEAQKIQQYFDNLLVWHVRITDGEEEYIGTVTPGGWIANQNRKWSIRFEAETTRLGRYDLQNCIVVVEIKE